MQPIMQRRSQIIKVFYLIFILLIAISTWGVWQAYNSDPSTASWYNLGLQFGKASLIIYILTMIPGIMRRFKVTNSFSVVLMTFRRYTGILMFLLALAHYWLVQGWVILQQGIPEPIPFQIFGLVSLLILFPLFLTSNDYSVEKLRHFWKTIHKLTYLAMFFILLHVAFQRISVWSVLAAILVATQMASYVYSRIILNQVESSSNESNKQIE